MITSFNKYPINLQLFADPDPDPDPNFDLNLDEPPVEDDLGEGGAEPGTEVPPVTPPAGEGVPAGEEDYFLPGVAKTKEDLLKQRKKEKQYMRQLEAKNKELQGQIKKEPVTQQSAPDENVYKQALGELGITEEEFIANPMETNIKILQYINEKMIPAGMQQVGSIVGEVKAEILKDKVKELYPDFDMDGQEEKVANILKNRYRPEFIKSHSLKLVLGIIKELGGKKKGGKSTDGTGFHSEEPTSESPATQAAKGTANAIRDRIRKAKIGTADITQL